MDKTVIVCAAIRNKDGLIVTGVRHGCPIMHAQLKAMGFDGFDPTWEQGFVTNKFDFVDRIDAKRIAKHAMQLDITSRTAMTEDRRLLSEDLY